MENAFRVKVEEPITLVEEKGVETVSNNEEKEMRQEEMMKKIAELEAKVWELEKAAAEAEAPSEEKAAETEAPNEEVLKKTFQIPFKNMGIGVLIGVGVAGLVAGGYYLYENYLGGAASADAGVEIIDF